MRFRNMKKKEGKNGEISYSDGAGNAFPSKLFAHCGILLHLFILKASRWCCCFWHRKKNKWIFFNIAFSCLVKMKVHNFFRVCGKYHCLNLIKYNLKSFILEKWCSAEWKTHFLYSLLANILKKSLWQL